MNDPDLMRDSATSLQTRLISLGLLTREQLRVAQQEQRTTGESLEAAVSRLGFVSDEALRGVWADQRGELTVRLRSVVPDPVALAFIPKHVAKRLEVFPVSCSGGELLVAAADPHDVVKADQLHALLAHGPRVRWAWGDGAELLSAIERCYGHELSIEGILHELQTGRPDPHSLARQHEAFTHPVVRLVDALLADATLQGASDLHFEPEAGFLRIRYRLDGVLRQVRAFDLGYWPAMLVRLKVMAGMNIAEARAPQDGRLSLSIAGHAVDFRAAVLPTLHGENFVLRILDRKRNVLTLEELGMTPPQLALLQRMLARPEGIVLVTGPTGAGKTTTLYSILAHLNAEGVNIMTLEDPVEYALPFVRQTSVGEAVKMGFGDGIRSMMRQDPDIILVGEVRDRDTAEMAFRAAMTGHQVFSTLHTNSAIRSIPRLFDLGVAPEILAGNVIGIVAQRLVRRLCAQCRQARDPTPQELQMLGGGSASPQRLYYPVGCAKCAFQGYLGRVAIVELLRFDDELDELVTQRASLKAMSGHLRNRGFATLAEDGLRRVRDGVTTLDEVARVVDLTNWMP